jgi:hypothetical protein
MVLLSIGFLLRSYRLVYLPPLVVSKPAVGPVAIIVPLGTGTPCVITKLGVRGEGRLQAPPLRWSRLIRFPLKGHGECMVGTPSTHQHKGSPATYAFIRLPSIMALTTL